MIPGITLVFVGLDALCLLLYLGRRRRRQARRRTKINYLGLYAEG